MRTVKFLLATAMLICASTFAHAQSRAVSCADVMGFTLEKTMRVGSVRAVSFANVIASAHGGLQKGDKIQTLNSVPVNRPADFEKVCTYFKTERPGRWEIGVLRREAQLVLAPDAGFECDPFTLVGCGRVPPMRR